MSSSARDDSDAAVAVKFCGLTREVDAARAAGLGARYVGVIFAGGPRALSTSRAREVLDGAATTHSGPEPARVGVMGAESADEIAARARAAHLDVVQLHSDPTPDLVDAVRAGFGGAVWGVLRLSGPTVPPGAVALAQACDAIVVDSRVAGRPWGGTGVALDWDALAPALEPLRAHAPLVLAGGLRADNVADAIAALGPAVVDVSSGVEREPGVKDHDEMQRFARAAAGDAT